MAQPIARCGTDSGYYRHRNRKEPACAKCLRAHADATAARDRGGHGPRRHCPCGSQIRTQYDKCYMCRRIDASLIGPEPVWVLRGGVYRDVAGVARQVAS
jgi:hypothetical protein